MVRFVSYTVLLLHMSFRFLTFITHPQSTYVKGFFIDWDKIKILVDAKDDKDPKIDQLNLAIMREFIDRDKNPICLARRIGTKGKLCSVVSLGEESVSEDLEELKKKELIIPKYLMKLSAALTGPEVFEIWSW